MIRAAIVEDDAEEMQIIKSYLERCSKEQGLNCVIDLYTDGDEIVDGVRAGYDLIIMDIELPLLNGMDAAEQIRTVDKDATIIFTTHNPNYAIRGYKVQALDYLLKPVSYKAFEEVMGRALKERVESSRKYIRVKIRNATVKLDVSMIRYVDVLDHYICYHTTEGDVKTKASMREAVQALEGESFFQCNKAFLVNLAYVDGISGNDLIVSGERIPVSRARKKAFMEAMNQYLTR
jgi:DNA-binding LytR/AlgR family response regulator